MIGFGNTNYGGSSGSTYGAFNPWAQEYQNALMKMGSSGGGNTYYAGGGGNVETPQYAAQNNSNSSGAGFGGYQPLPAYQLYQLNNQAESYLPSDLQIDSTAMANAGQTASDQYMRNVVNPSVATSLSNSAAQGTGDSTFAAATAASLQANGAAQAQQVNNDAQNAYAQRVEGLRNSYFQGASNTPNTTGTNYNQFGLGEQSNNTANGQLGVAQGQLGLAQQTQNYNEFNQNRQYGLQQGAAIGGAIGNLFGF